ncbi:MAG: S9 family peptidase, partial [Acidobacteria bacterium]|nr:S9 family peptidase [Acidobacteriota bacterium]
MVEKSQSRRKAMKRVCHRYSGIGTLCLLLLLCGSGWLWSNAKEPLTAGDYFQLENVSDPQIAPDGSSVVFVRQWPDIMTDRQYSNLWIVNFDGSDLRPLTTGEFSDSSPRWSPDGLRLAYISNREGDRQIHVRWMDTGQ